MQRAVIAAVVTAVALLLSIPAAMVAAEAKPPTKVSADLAALPARHAAGATAAAPAPAAPMAGGWAISNAFMPVSGDWVAINAVATGDPAALAADLSALGARNVAVAGHLVSASFPIQAIPSLEALTSLRFARPAYRKTNVGSVTSQGDGAMHSDTARTRFGLDGSGVTVGVLSDSFNCQNGFGNDTATGDLPATVTVLEDSFSNCTDEGRAMLQIVYDVAPNASLAFATADNGQANFANNIRALQTAGAKVIVDDVIYFDEPMFQDGIVAQAVDEVVASGVSYFSAAGNEGRNGYDHVFVPGTIPPNLDIDARFLGGTPHKFGTTSLQTVTAPGGSQFLVVLQWDSPFASVSGPPGAQNALDIYFLVPDGAGGLFILFSSTSDSLTSGDPFTLFGVSCNAPIGARCPAAFIMIVNRDGPNPGRFKYVVFSAGGSPTPSPAFNAGTIYGHPNASGAVAVGASFYKTPLTLEPFSSGGTTPILLDTAGNPLATPDPRHFKPEIVAPDGVDTTFFGFPNDPEFNGFPNFFGTSAAAPHAAAVAALMLQALPTLTPDDLRTTLQQTATNMGAAGFDNNSGFGLINADRALTALHQFVITAGPTATPNPVSPGGLVNLSVTATDNFGHTLTYVWSALCTGLTSNGVFDDATAQAPTWTAPANTTGASKTCAIKVTVSDGQGFTRTGSVTETVRSVPKITTLTPASGPVGTLVTITGLSLGQVTDVTFSLNSTVPATLVTATSVKAIVPEGAVTGPVRLTSPDGTGTSPGIFKVTPKITDFTPASGVTGDQVTINGFNLQVGSATPTVKFGAGPGTVVSATPTQIVASIVATSLTGKITVMTTDGTGMSATDFVVIKPPTITAFTPAMGPVGTTVMITGTNLNSVTEVRLNDVALPSFTILTATSLRVVIPTGATTGKFGVTNPAGSVLSAGIFKVTPKITDFTPASGVTGNTVTINGFNLQVGSATPTVKFGAGPATVTSATPTSIVATILGTSLTGKISVMTTDGTGMSATDFVVIKPPTITAFTPAMGPVGTTVMITGTNLNSVTEVRLNDVALPSFTILTATSLRVVIPTGATTGKFGVTNPAGSVLSAGSFKATPRITDFTPASGVTGNTVTINGFNLQVGSATPTVKFGAGPATVTSATPTSIVATILGTSLTGKISVMTTDGTGMSATDFVVIKPPTITAFTPAMGPVGTTVTLTGTNLNSVTEVRLNDVALPSFTILTATSLRVEISTGATTGKFGVTNPAGSVLSAGIFKVTPKITDFTPASGVTGDQVTINGFNLQVGSATPTVKFGAGPATVTSATPTSIVATILGTSLTGKISVMTTDGTGMSATDFVVIKPPTITAFTPAMGPVGTMVTLTGTNLNSVTEVRLNDVALPSFTILTATSLRVVIPIGATTGKFGVTNPAGSVLSAGIFKVTPKIDSFTPMTGPALTSVTISGSNLKVGAVDPTVKIGALMVPATAVTASTDTSVTITVPATAVTGKISVMTADGTGISTDNFVVIKLPTITSFTPTSGQVGALVTITGTNLGTVSDVTFGGASQPTFTIVSATSLKANVPGGATTGKIAVTNPAGTATSAANFTVLP